MDEDFERTSKGLLRSAVGCMCSGVAELTGALAEFESQYLRVYESRIDNAIRRLREAESALVEATVIVKRELQRRKE